MVVTKKHILSAFIFIIILECIAFSVFASEHSCKPDEDIIAKRENDATKLPYAIAFEEISKLSLLPNTKYPIRSVCIGNTNQRSGANTKKCDERDVAGNSPFNTIPNNKEIEKQSLYRSGLFYGWSSVIQGQDILISIDGDGGLFVFRMCSINPHVGDKIYQQGFDDGVELAVHFGKRIKDEAYQHEKKVVDAINQGESIESILPSLHALRILKNKLKNSQVVEYSGL